MRLKVLQFVAVVLVALALVPVGAHLLARPNKIHLPADQYFTTQSVYLGWAVPTGTVLIAAIIVTLVYTIAMRGHGIAFWLSLTAFILTAATLAIFFIWTFPANQATQTGRSFRRIGMRFVRNGNSATCSMRY